MTNMHDLVKLADHASAATDRWLFIGTLIVLGAFAMLVMRYFVNQHERLIEDHKVARDTYQSSLRDMVDETHKTNRDLAVVISKNTEALNNCAGEMALCRKQRP